MCRSATVPMWKSEDNSWSQFSLFHHVCFREHPAWWQGHLTNWATLLALDHSSGGFKDYVFCLKVPILQNTYVKKRCFWWVFVAPNSTVLCLMLPNFTRFPLLTSKVPTSLAKPLPILQGSSQSHVFLRKTCLVSRCSQVPREYLCSKNIGSALIGASFQSPWLSLHQRTAEILDFARWPLRPIPSSYVRLPYCSCPVRRVSRFNVYLVFWVHWVEGMCKKTR